MADPRKFSGYNNVLQAPPGLEEFIRPLPVHHTGKEAISCWQLTEAEKHAVAETGLVWIVVAGDRHPPIMLSGLPMMQAHDANGLLEKYDVNKGLSPEDLENSLMTVPVEKSVAEHIKDGLKEAIEIANGTADPSTYRVHEPPAEEASSLDFIEISEEELIRRLSDEFPDAPGKVE